MWFGQEAFFRTVTCCLMIAGLLVLVCRHGGVSFLIKTRNNKWLGNAATYKDFFFSTGQLPEMSVVTGPSSAAGAAGSGLKGPDKTLDTDK